MSQPGWHPDPEGSGQLRWWDGQQWTSATQMRQQVPLIAPQPPKVPQTPEQKRRNYIAAGVLVLLLVALFGINAWKENRDDRAENRAATSEAPPTTTATTTSRARVAPVAPTYVPPARTTTAAVEPIFDDEDTYMFTLSASPYDYPESREYLLYSGHFVCEQLADGKSVETVGTVLYVSNDGWSIQQSGYLTGVAISAFCPEYK